VIWFATYSLACRSQIRMPISEKRGIDEEGVRVRLPMRIEAAGVNASAALGRILPHSVSSFVTFCVNICQQFYQPTKEEV